MNKKKLLFILSISALSLTAIFEPLVHDYSFNSKASISKTVNVLSLLKDALKDKKVNVTPVSYSLYSESDNATYTFEVSNAFINESNRLVIKRDGYIRNLTAFNGMSVLTFDFDGSSTGVDAILGSYDKEEKMITMDSRKTESTIVVDSTNFSLRNKDSNLEDQILTKLNVTYACTNGDNNNVSTESAIWSEDFDFYSTTQFGTEEDPYLIDTCAGMRALARVNNSGIDLTGQYFSLTHSLDFAGEGVDYVPVGTDLARFNGTFIGNSGLFTLDETIDNFSGWGLFGSIGENGTVKNISATGELRMNRVSYSGTIAGECRGKISTCVVVMTFKGLNDDTMTNCTYVGGLVGALYDGTIYNSTAAVTMKVNDSCGAIGGFLGYMQDGATMNTVDSACELTATDNALFIGGYIGTCQCTVPFDEVVTYYAKLNDSHLHYNFSDTVGGEQVLLDFGTTNNRYHGRYAGFSTYEYNKQNS